MPPSPSRHFVTDEPHRFGSGWISGTSGAILGIAAAGTAACMALPDHLTTPALRATYSIPFLRAALDVAMLAASVLGALSLALRRKKTLGAIALGTALLAGLLVLLGPSSPPSPTSSVGLGLDVFVLSLVVYAGVFVPLERVWPLRADQPTFRQEWWTDLAWFFVSALLMQATASVVLAPARLLSFTVEPRVQEVVRALPAIVQFALIVLLADLVQYWVHRACHRVPLLWRFHAIHHSATAMDWLAGSRLHVVDAILTRSLVYLPLALLGFAPGVIGAYLVFVAAQATFVHANVRWRFDWLAAWLVTPRFHHWHHADSVANVNFAVHLPWLDRLFGTFHLPPQQQWPRGYGLAPGACGPRGFLRQLVAPFQRR